MTAALLHRSLRPCAGQIDTWKYYGWKMAAFIAATFYATLVVAGYAVALLRLVPSQQRNASVMQAHLSWNYTTWLNIVLLVLAALLVVRFLPPAVCDAADDGR